MLIAIQLVWWIGLIVALVLTLAILKEVALVINALRDINALADYILEASHGLGKNVAVESQLQALKEPARMLQESSRRMADTSSLWQKKLAAVAGSDLEGD